MQIGDLEKAYIPIYDVKNQLRDYIYERTRSALKEGEQARSEILNLEQLESRKCKIRSKLLEGIGGLPPFDTPLRPRITNVLRCKGFRIESIVFESRPNTFVTSNLYIPDSREIPDGAVLFVCGHRDLAKHDPDYQMVCQKLVLAGLVVMAIDPIGQGERHSYADQTDDNLKVGLSAADHEHAGAQCWPLGDGLARYFLHDIMRAIDYLGMREEVNPKRIGITGNSGGGVQTSLAMICENRIAAAAPGTFLSSRGSILLSGLPQDAEQIWPGMAGAGYDHADILLAFAPRPLMVLAVTEDFFPIEGTRKTVEEARRFWKMYSKGEALVLAEDKSNHQYTEYLADRAASFFADCLLDDKNSQQNGLLLIDPKKLHCTSTGQVKLDYTNARAVYEENIDRLDALEQERRAMSPKLRKLRAKQWLRDKVYTARSLVDPNPRMCNRWQLADPNLSVSSFVWFSQQNLLSHALLFEDPSSYSPAAMRPLSVGIWEGGTHRLEAHLDWITKTCSEGRIAMILNVSGVGMLEPHSVYPVYELHDRFGTMHKFQTDLFGLDDSLAAIRIFEVIRAIDVAKELSTIDPTNIVLYSKGSFSFYAEMASFLEDGAYGLNMEEGLVSIADIIRSRFYRRELLSGFILPGMLRYLDVSDLR